MHFTATTALFVAGASASIIGGYGAPAPVPAKNATAPVWVTEVLTAFTTYCPEATTLTHGGVTYSVPKGTFTVPECTTTYSSVYSVPTTAPIATPTPVVTKPVYTTPAAPYTYYNATTPVVPPTSSPSASKVTSSGPLQATANAASNAFARSGAALAGVFGAVAYLL
jgi:hypothetical protein